MCENSTGVARTVFPPVRHPNENASSWTTAPVDLDPDNASLIAGGIVAGGPAPACFSNSFQLTASERNVLATLLVQQRRYESNCEIITRGEPSTRALILQKGWACAHRSLPSGARQVLSVYVPGDLIGYPPASSTSQEAGAYGHNVSTITETEVSEVGLDRLTEALAMAPRLARAMFWDAARANAILEERLISLGRRNARGRTAHFYLELSVRLRSCGQGHASRFRCPLSQDLISDALGLSAEHLNRVLKQLRIAGLLQVRKGWVEFVNRDALVRLADFDSDYLAANTDLAV